MAWGDNSAPARFGFGQSTTDDRNLFLKMFGGEVLAAFDLKTIFLDKHRSQTITQGKSFQFPKTWKAIAEYHTAGQEMLGNDIDTSEINVTVDGLVVAHVSIYDLDAKMSHFEVMSEYSKQLGLALARNFDRNIARSIVRSARLAADGPFPGGDIIVDPALTNTGTINGLAWINAIRQMRLNKFNKDVPDEGPFYVAVNGAVFDAIKYAVDANGRYLLINRDTGNLSMQMRTESIQLDDVIVLRTRNLPVANETADVNVFPKYRANYSTVTGVFWHPSAVATVKLMDLAMESTRDVRRQEEFMVAKMACGTDPLRPESAGVFQTA